MEKEYYTVPELVKKLQMRKQSVYAAIKRGDIETVTFGKEKLIPAKVFHSLQSRLVNERRFIKFV